MRSLSRPCSTGNAIYWGCFLSTYCTQALCKGWVGFTCPDPCSGPILWVKKGARVPERPGFRPGSDGLASQVNKSEEMAG